MKDTDIIAQLADIQPPPAPESGVLALTFVTIAAVSVAVAIYIKVYKRSEPAPAQHIDRTGALERLTRLEQEWGAGRLDDRQTAFRMAALVRLGLGQPQWPSSNVDEAHPLGERLSHLRYERSPAGAVDHALFASARECLQRETTKAC